MMTTEQVDENLCCNNDSAPDAEHTEMLHEIDRKRNLWSQWGSEIETSVKEVITKEVGDRDNPYYMPALAKYLLDDICLISRPMWGCVMHDKFNYDKKQSSSAGI